MELTHGLDKLIHFNGNFKRSLMALAGAVTGIIGGGSFMHSILSHNNDLQPAPQSGQIEPLYIEQNDYYTNAEYIQNFYDKESGLDGSILEQHELAFLAGLRLDNTQLPEILKVKSDCNKEGESMYLAFIGVNQENVQSNETRPIPHLLGCSRMSGDNYVTFPMSSNNIIQGSSLADQVAALQSGKVLNTADQNNAVSPDYFQDDKKLNIDGVVYVITPEGITAGDEPVEGIKPIELNNMESYVNEVIQTLTKKGDISEDFCTVSAYKLENKNVLNQEDFLIQLKLADNRLVEIFFCRSELGVNGNENLTNWQFNSLPGDVQTSLDDYFRNTAKSIGDGTEGSVGGEVINLPILSEDDPTTLADESIQPVPEGKKRQLFVQTYILGGTRHTNIVTQVAVTIKGEEQMIPENTEDDSNIPPWLLYLTASLGGFVTAGYFMKNSAGGNSPKYKEEKYIPLDADKVNKYSNLLKLFTDQIIEQPSEQLVAEGITAQIFSPNSIESLLNIIDFAEYTRNLTLSARQDILKNINNEIKKDKKYKGTDAKNIADQIMRTLSGYMANEINKKGNIVGDLIRNFTQTLENDFNMKDRSTPEAQAVAIEFYNNQILQIPENYRHALGLNIKELNQQVEKQVEKFEFSFGLTGRDFETRQIEDPESLIKFFRSLGSTNERIGRSSKEIQSLVMAIYEDQGNLENITKFLNTLTPGRAKLIERLKDEINVIYQLTKEGEGKKKTKVSAGQLLIHNDKVTNEVAITYFPPGSEIQENQENFQIAERIKKRRTQRANEIILVRDENTDKVEELSVEKAARKISHRIATILNQTNLPEVYFDNLKSMIDKYAPHSAVKKEVIAQLADQIMLVLPQNIIIKEKGKGKQVNEEYPRRIAEEVYDYLSEVKPTNSQDLGAFGGQTTNILENMDGKLITASAAKEWIVRKGFRAQMIKLQDQKTKNLSFQVILDINTHNQAA